MGHQPQRRIRTRARMRVHFPTQIRVGRDLPSRRMKPDPRALNRHRHRAARPHQARETKIRLWQAPYRAIHLKNGANASARRHGPTNRWLP